MPHNYPWVTHSNEHSKITLAAGAHAGSQTGAQRSMRINAVPAAITTTTALWGLVAISVASHWRGPLNAALIGAAATAALSTVILGSARSSQRANEALAAAIEARVEQVAELTEAGQLIREAQEQPPTPTLRPHQIIHTVDDDDQPLIVGAETGAIIDLDAVRKAIDEQRRNAAS